MLGCDQVEELIHIIRALDRNGMIDHLRNHQIRPASAVYPQDGCVKTGTSVRAARFLHVGSVLRINRASQS